MIHFTTTSPKGCGRQWCPVTVYAPAATFKSIKAAAKHLGVPVTTLRTAVEAGTAVANHFAVYADMPLACQPHKKGRRIPVKWEGKYYPSIAAAARGDKNLWMRIWRAVGRDPRG